MKKGIEMKMLTLFTLLGVLCLADDAQMKVDIGTQLMRYNHRSSVVMGHKRTLKELAKVSTEEAKKTAEALCKTEITSVRLKHRGQLLYYRAEGKGCQVEINALDGAVISKKENK